MSFQHTNRRGDVYHLQASERCGDSVAYAFARKLTGKPIERLPEGYEAYENPENAQVFIRKIKPTNILALEKQLVEASIRNLAKLEHFIVAVEGDSLVVYRADTEPDAAVDRLSAILGISAEQARTAKQFMVRRAMYTKMMRFVLTDTSSRRFSAERWCFLGSIDNWYLLSGDKPLVKLVESYVPHLGRESFFELE